MTTRLTWHHYPSKADNRYTLFHGPALLGGVRRVDPGRWKAECETARGREWVMARTAEAARKTLERIIDRRSIGLFGADDVTFRVLTMRQTEPGIWEIQPESGEVRSARRVGALAQGQRSRRAPSKGPAGTTPPDREGT